MKTVYIGLGSNLAEPGEQLKQALLSLAQLPHSDLTLVSAFYGSSPIGGPADQPNYTNACACIETRLSPETLLDQLQAIEQAHGRVRTVRWGPRTLDLDILLFGEYELTTERLTIPHQRLTERAFVLVPLLEIAPALTLPDGTPLAPFCDAVADQGLWQLPDDFC